MVPLLVPALAAAAVLVLWPTPMDGAVRVACMVAEPVGLATQPRNMEQVATAFWC